MKDSCLRGISLDGGIKVWAANTTNICNEIRKRHDTMPIATAALGRLATGALFFGLNQKGEDTVTLRMDGDGELGALIAVANAHGEVKAYVNNPHVETIEKHKGKLDVGQAVGKGMLTVIKDLGFGEPYGGSVPIVTGEIGDDLVSYLYLSEQVPSSMGLGVLIDTDLSVKAAGGFLVQLMPNVEDKVISQLELNIELLPPVSNMLENELTLKEMINELMLGIEWKELETDELEFACDCSKERMSKALISLGAEELEEIIEDGEKCEMNCRFCGEKHVFSVDELKDLVIEINSKNS